MFEPQIPRSRQQDALLEDLDLFLTARLCLILLPVRTHLREIGCRELAEAVQIGVRNIRPTLDGILSKYHFHQNYQGGQ